VIVAGRLPRTRATLHVTGCLAIVVGLAACSALGRTAAPSPTTATPTNKSPASSVDTSPPRPAIHISVLRNLDNKPINALVVAAGKRYAAPDGKIVLTDIAPGTSVYVFANGYDTVEVTKAARVVLTAGPAATAEYLGRQQIAKRYDLQVKFVHPNELRYVSANWIQKTMRDRDIDGRSQLRWTLTSAGSQARWHYRGCRGKGAAMFTDVAVVKYVSTFSVPKGPPKTRHRIEHLVLSGGLWRWFPAVPKRCP
jgi:hypothetical protein